MIYECIIYYKDDSFVAPAINFMAAQHDIHPRLTSKVDNVVIPIGENDSLKINAIRSLSKSNSQLIDTDYIIIQRELLKPKLQELWVKLREQARINWWIKDEKTLREN